MRVRICDNCHVIIRGPYHKVIGIGSRPGKTMDLCPKCIASLYPMEAPVPKMKKPEPRLRSFYDVPLDGSPIKVREVDPQENMKNDPVLNINILNPDHVDRILNSGDYPPNPSPK